MARIHVSDDGVPRPCRAQTPASCTVRSADGSEVPHGDFESISDAWSFAEGVAAQRMAAGGHSDFGTSSRSDSAPESNPDLFHRPVSSYGGDLNDELAPGESFSYDGSIYKLTAPIGDPVDGMLVLPVTDSYGDRINLGIYEHESNNILLQADEPLNREDPESYTIQWDSSSYLGQYISRGESFAYRGEIYTAEEWEWNRALLETRIQVQHRGADGTEELRIVQGDEESVTFTLITESGEDRRMLYARH